MAADVLCCGWHAIATTTFHDSTADTASDVATEPSVATSAIAALATSACSSAAASRVAEAVADWLSTVCCTWQEAWRRGGAGERRGGACVEEVVRHLHEGNGLLRPLGAA